MYCQTFKQACEVADSSLPCHQPASLWPLVISLVTLNNGPRTAGDIAGDINRFDIASGLCARELDLHNNETPVCVPSAAGSGSHKKVQHHDAKLADSCGAS